MGELITRGHKPRSGYITDAQVAAQAAIQESKLALTFSTGFLNASIISLREAITQLQDSLEGVVDNDEIQNSAIATLQAAIVSLTNAMVTKVALAEAHGASTVGVNNSVMQLPNNPTTVQATLEQLNVRIDTLAAAAPKFEPCDDLSPQINDTTDLFRVAQGRYTPGKLFVSSGGRVRWRGVEYFEEDPANGIFRMCEPLIADDVPLICSYLY